MAETGNGTTDRSWNNSGLKEMKKEEPGLNVQERLEQKFLESNVNFLFGEIDEETVGKIIQWILYENLDVSRQKILTLYINSEGGSLYDAFALIDVMRISVHPIRTVAFGSVMSAAFLIFASGAKGERYIAPNTGILCHQFSSDIEGKYHDMKALSKENDLCNERMLNILRDASSLEPRLVKSRLLPASDVWLTAEELLEMGIADNFYGR